MQRLSGLDAAFLTAETPSVHMNILGVLVLDPTTAPEPFTFDRVRALVSARLPYMPVLRWKLVVPPLGISHGVWADDPDFDLDYHLHKATLPAPGGREELARFTASIAGNKLDRSRPLWELWYVDGLADGHVALIGKLHHAKADGAAGLGVLEGLFDLEATAPLVPARDPEPAPDEPSVVALAGSVLDSAAEIPRAAVRTVSKVASAGASLVRRLNPADLDAAMPFTGPNVSFSRSISPSRSVGFAEFDLADVKFVKNAFGVTVNDAVLAVVAGALRRYLSDRGELPDRPLVAAVPKSIRVDESGRNAISTMFASMHVEISDPARRLRMTQRKADAGKEVQREFGDDTLGELFEATPGPLISSFMGIYHRLRIADRSRSVANLVASNVPGPPIPVYMAGARLVQLYPIGPVIDGTGLNITITSYIDRMFASMLGDGVHVPEPERIADGMVDALAELVKVAQRYAPQ